MLLRIDDAPLPDAFWPIVAVIVALFVVYTLIIRWLANRHIRALAARLGLDPTDSDNQNLLSGLVRGKRVRFSEISTDFAENDINSPNSNPPAEKSIWDDEQRYGRLNNIPWAGNPNRAASIVRQHWAEMAVAVNSHEFEFTIQPETMATKMRELLGEGEVKVDDEAFDQRWRIQATRRETLLALLTPELRTKINQAFDCGDWGEFRIEYKWLCYREQGTFANDSRLRRYEGMLDLMFDLADAVEVAVESGHKL